MEEQPMSEKIFETKNRDEAHRVLEYVVDQARNFQRLDANGVDKDFPGVEKFDRQFHPAAECREDPNAELPYSVWSGPA
jgi:hypothetical protein